MENENLVAVETFSNVMEATIAKGRLEASGIPCHLANENLVQMYPMLSQAVGGFQLQVPTSRAAEAREILGAALPESGQSPVEPLRCPSCGGQHVRRKLLSRIWVLISWLVLTAP